MKQEQITLRCEDGQEAVVFTKYTYKNIAKVTEGQVKLCDGYEIMVEDSYIGGDYTGFFGRVKRAWRAFWDKPVVYTGIYCEDERKMRQFLYDCLDLINNNSDSEETPADKTSPYCLDKYGIYCEDDSVTSNEELINGGNSNVI